MLNTKHKPQDKAGMFVELLKDHSWNKAVKVLKRETEKQKRK